MTLSLQEVLSKTETQRKLIQETMERSGRKGGFHPDERTGENTYCTIYDGLGKADFNDVRETMAQVPFKKLMEFLGKSGTTGIAGAAYLIPDKIYDIMFRKAYASDLTAQAMRIVDTPGSTLKVDYATGGYRPKRFGSGGAMPEDTLQTGQLTITPATYGINARITNELIEDSQWDVVQMHLEEAAKACAAESTAQSVATLVAASNGDGTLNTISTGVTGVWDFDDIMGAWKGNADDGYISDTIIAPPAALRGFASDDSVSKYSNDYHTRAVSDAPTVMGNFKGMTIHALIGEIAYYNDTGSYILNSGSKDRALVYNKEEAALCVRKRWLKIENYSDPVKDLVGATVTFREGYSTVNKDAICLMTET